MPACGGTPGSPRCSRPNAAGPPRGNRRPSRAEFGLVPPEKLIVSRSDSRFLFRCESRSKGGGLVVTWLTKVGLNDPVSRHLHPDCARILVSQTVSEALADLRRNPPQGRILYLYVVDDQGRL